MGVEHLDDVEAMANPAGYLFRVGQSAAKRLMAGDDNGVPYTSHRRARSSGRGSMVSCWRRCSGFRPTPAQLCCSCTATGSPTRGGRHSWGVGIRVTNMFIEASKRLRRLLEDGDANR